MAALFDAITTTLDRARRSDHGRHAELLVHDGPLRQTVIALLQGMRMSEHNSPPAASIQMIRGRVTVTGEETVTLETGTIEALTHHRHSVEALDDSVFLLTTVTSVPGAESHSAPGTHTSELLRVREDE
ncbi:hypothetical protein CFK38_03030 [Brachybacterium vulturis]|uniref:Cupin n=1 Tax=Brachybacterium vulturis TaxID=2017484 RepID=A0A291GKX2_9MICO|nr:hypothetical protein [Brachybacterium vulturis]ATG50604.1 hypothetical protein CFK38_03030 [Brachybacterium vulturis]